MSDQKQQTEKKKNILKRLVGYEWIVKNLLFFLFLTLLAVLYIANGHMADNTVRDINKTAKEVKDLQYQYKTLKSEEIFKSRESAIVEAATPLGLQISQDKPIPLVSDEKQ